MKSGLWIFLLGSALLVGIAAFVLLQHRGRMEPRAQSPAPVASAPAVPSAEPVYDGKPLSYWVIKAGQVREFYGVPDDAIAAIRAIGAQAVPFLLNWMPHPETIHQYANRSANTPAWDTLEFAWSALGTDGKSAIPVLARIINQPMRTMDDYSVWTESAKAISYLGPDAIAPMLTAASNMQGNHVMWELIHNLQNMGSNGAPAIPAIIHWTNDPDYFVRDAVVSALGGIGQRPDLALPVILDELEHDTQGMVRRDAAEALGAFANGSDAVLPELVKMLKDPDWEAREGALSGLGQITDKPDVIIPLVTPFLTDPNSVIERSAAYALLRLNCKAAYDALAAYTNPNIGDIVHQAGEQEKARRKQLK